MREKSGLKNKSDETIAARGKTLIILMEFDVSDIFPGMVFFCSVLFFLLFFCLSVSKLKQTVKLWQKKISHAFVCKLLKFQRISNFLPNLSNWDFLSQFV